MPAMTLKDAKSVFNKLKREGQTVIGLKSFDHSGKDGSWIVELRDERGGYGTVREKG